MIIGKDTIPVEEKILATLQKDYNLDPIQVTNEVQKNRFNNFTTTYYLLFKRKERAAIFRQQYNDEVKKLLQRKKKQKKEPPQEISEVPALDAPPASPI